MADKKKSWRRVTGALVGAILVTFAFYYAVEKGLDFEWFKGYSTIIFGFILILIPGLTVTDVLGKK